MSTRCDSLMAVTTVNIRLRLQNLIVTVADRDNHNIYFTHYRYQRQSTVESTYDKFQMIQSLARFLVTSSSRLTITRCDLQLFRANKNKLIFGYTALQRNFNLQHVKFFCVGLLVDIWTAQLYFSDVLRTWERVCRLQMAECDVGWWMTSVPAAASGSAHWLYVAVLHLHQTHYIKELSSGYRAMNSWWRSPSALSWRCDVVERDRRAATWTKPIKIQVDHTCDQAGHDIPNEILSVSHPQSHRLDAQFTHLLSQFIAKLKYCLSRKYISSAHSFVGRGISNRVAEFVISCGI